MIRTTSKRALANSPERASTTKKSRAKPAQSNTLLNYFQSNKPREPVKPELVQKSLFDYFKSNSTDQTPEDEKVNLKYDLVDIRQIGARKHQVEIKQEQTLIKQEETLIKREQKEEFISIDTELMTEIEDREETTIDVKPSTETARKCPFYKRIEGTKIAVDAFSYGNIENVNVYFLSHFHYDHYVGLSKHFKNRIYCSRVTANLVLKKIRVEKEFVIGLELNKFINVYPDDESIQVALIDANHCPGSVMFLFRFKKTGKYILHTGDFRASDELINNAFFRNIHIHTIHLDTTYCDSYYNFLPQSKIISLGVELVQNELEKFKNRHVLIVCGSYTIGKERIFLAIAEHLNIKVCVCKEKMSVLNCLEDAKLDKILTLNPNETFLHVISMGMLNVKDLQNYLSKFDKYEYLIAIKPSGWTHKEPGKSNSTDGYSIERKAKNIILYGLEYSEHSSFDELKKCIQTLRPAKIIPTVNVARKESRDMMQGYFNEWMKIKTI